MNVDQVTGKVLVHETTLSEARLKVYQQILKGTKCPCCDQVARMYSRPLTSSMAYGLYMLKTASETFKFHDGWIHIETYFKESTAPSSIRADIPKLRFWGLIESKLGAKNDGNPNSGYYRVTPHGKLFVEGKILMQSHVLIYNNESLGHPKHSKQVSFGMVIKNKFNYTQTVNPA